MAGTVEVFNELLLDFVCNLAKTYSHVTALQVAPNQLKIAMKADKHQIHQEFMKCMTPHYDDIVQRNDIFFTTTSKDIEFLNTADFINNWTNSPKATQDSIWEYLYNLMIIGGSINILPPDLMSNISNFVDNYTSTNDGDLNIEHLIASLQNDEAMSKIFSDSGKDHQA
jgi:hypothetical protein